MKLGISSYTYTWHIGVAGHMPEQSMRSLDLLNKAAQLGIHLVQVADNLPLHCLSDEELKAFRLLASRLDIQVEVGTRGIQPDHLHAYLDLAQRLKSNILRAVVDTEDQHPDADEVVRTLKAVISEFESRGICLAIENHDRFKVKTLANIIEKIGSPSIGVCLDTVNSFGALESPVEVVRVLGPLTVNLHIKDFIIRRVSHKMGFVVEGKPAGQGMLDIPWLLSELKQYRRDPNAILELWTTPGDKLEDTLTREEAWAEQSIEYLRGYIKE